MKLEKAHYTQAKIQLQIIRYYFIQIITGEIFLKNRFETNKKIFCLFLFLLVFLELHIDGIFEKKTNVYKQQKKEKMYTKNKTHVFFGSGRKTSIILVIQ